MVLMTLSAIGLFFYARVLLRDQVEEELYSNKDRIEKLLIEDQTVKGIPPIMEVKVVNCPEALKLNDTLIYDPLQDEVELFEQLSETKEINGQYYRVTVRAMVIESEDILFAIVFMFITILFLAFLFLFYLNKTRNEKLWKPFFTNLEKLKKFSLQSDNPLQFNESDILEFDELNREMSALTTKVRADYRNLKQFTEDVSHELQTPLAIMQAKIDTIINDKNISETQFNQFSSLQTDVSRLKQLNKKLILLSKIDNDQFTATETVSINEVIKEVIINFKELSTIDIQLKAATIIETKMDRSLAIVLCNNLISNAIKHNVSEASIEIIITTHKVQILNEGTIELKKPDQIFERFYTENKKQDSTGLGLSIVKKICDYYCFKPSYCFKERKHIFQIDFNAKF